MQELSKTHSYVDFAAAGQDAFTRVALLALWGECKLKDRLADFSISCAKVRDIYCRRCRHQGMSILCLSRWLPSTLVRRKSQPIVPGFPSLYFDIGYWLFLEQTL